jgi:hypothetical protein
VTAPWWTPADRAEQDVRVREFVARYVDHRKRCGHCRDGDPCRSKQHAIKELIDWRDDRSARSLAAELRRLENVYGAGAS